MAEGVSEGQQHHVSGGGFRNPWPSFSFDTGFMKFAKMMFSDWDRKRSQVTQDVKRQLGIPIRTNLEALLQPPKDEVQITWVGHATFLLQFEGVNVLTDPVWSDRCSPSQIVGPKRLVSAPFPLTELPPVDVVIISHNHYDHLDEGTVKKLGNKPLYLVPLGLKSWFTSLGITNVVELNWWQDHTVSFPDVGQDTKSLKATCTPCQHFSGRGLFDRNKTLWCSWVLEGKDRKVYFAGDTGFCTVTKDSEHPGGVPDNGEPVCPAFAEIGRKFGPFDAAFIPIGAYSPRYFMSAVHASPEDAVGIHLAVRSKQSIAMHWGTFVLTDEPILEPPVRLQQELSRLNLDPGVFITMKHGETRSFS
eukprot:TRINITY_DN13062_c0_g1_i1.p1 TRINITY_DN13062_c0_g1~~TRINITY_DN13062_c0_g1_i1.p1  ORF type:complete len:361 (+),score=39.76 TRINITY_DN13062_c0_g1_i1:95-1177(+)